MRCFLLVLACSIGFGQDVTVIKRRTVATGGTAPSFVSAHRGGDGFGCYHTTTCAPSAWTTTTGNYLAVAIVWQGATSLTGITDTCNTGGTSNTYTAVDNLNNSGGANGTATFYAKVGAGQSCTVTATYVGANTYSRIYVQEIAGVNATTPMITGHHAIQVLNAPGTGADAVTSGNITTTVANEYLFSYTNDQQGSTDTFSAGTGFTLEHTDYDGGNYVTAGEYRVVASPGTAAGTFTASAGAGYSGVTAVVAFQP